MNAPLSYAQYCQEMDRAKERYTRACNKLESRLLAFQKKCKHKNVIKVGGPIVGQTYCDTCDKIIKEDSESRIRRIASLNYQVKNLVAAIGKSKNEKREY